MPEPTKSDMPASSTVPPSAAAPLEFAPTPSKAPVLIGALVVVLVALGSAGYFWYSRQTPKSPSGSVVVQKAPESKSPTPLELRQPQNVGEAAYEAAFSAAISNASMTEGGFVDAKGVYVSLRDGSIGVRIPGTIPNLVFLPKGEVDIQVTDARDASGTSLFDPSNTFETDSFFTLTRLKEVSQPEYAFTGERRIHLKENVSSDDISRVDGHVVLNLPVGLTPIALTAADKGQTKQAVGKVLLEEWSVTPNNGRYDDAPPTTTEVTIRYEGFQEKIRAIKAYDASGAELDQVGGDDPYREGFATDEYHLAFGGAATVVKFFEADRSFMKSFPFTVDLASVASYVAPSGTQEEVVQSIIQTQNVLTSKDPKQIREYMRKYATATENRDQLEELNQQTDAQLLELSKMIEAFVIPGTPEQIREELLSSKTRWIWQDENHVTVKYRASQSDTMTLAMQKVNGAWY